MSHPTCAVEGCDEPVIVDHYAPGMVGVLHWTAMTAVCQGKRRHREEYAKALTLVRRHLDAYCCPVCDSWHNGTRKRYAQLLRTRAAQTRAHLTGRYGQRWFTEKIQQRWDPAAGLHSRERVAA